MCKHLFLPEFSFKICEKLLKFAQKWLRSHGRVREVIDYAETVSA